MPLRWQPISHLGHRDAIVSVDARNLFDQVGRVLAIQPVFRYLYPDGIIRNHFTAKLQRLEDTHNLLHTEADTQIPFDLVRIQVDDDRIWLDGVRINHPLSEGAGG